MGAHNSSHHQYYEQNENPRHQKRVKHNASGNAYRDYRKENSRPHPSFRGYQHDSSDETRQSR